MLAGLWEQLEATRAKTFIAMRQRILANNHAAMVEAERDRTHAMSIQQDHVERDLCQQLAQT